MIKKAQGHRDQILILRQTKDRFTLWWTIKFLFLCSYSVYSSSSSLAILVLYLYTGLPTFCNLHKVKWQPLIFYLTASTACSRRLILSPSLSNNLHHPTLTPLTFVDAWFSHFCNNCSHDGSTGNGMAQDV